MKINTWSKTMLLCIWRRTYSSPESWKNMHSFWRRVSGSFRIRPQVPWFLNARFMRTYKEQGIRMSLIDTFLFPKKLEQEAKNFIPSLQAQPVLLLRKLRFLSDSALLSRMKSIPVRRPYWWRLRPCPRRPARYFQDIDRFAFPPTHARVKQVSACMITYPGESVEEKNAYIQCGPICVRPDESHPRSY